MAGFLSPSILFLSTWDLPERQFMGALSRKLLDAGYTRIVEPCAGGLAMPAAHVQAGWLAEQMECSDTSLYTAIAGYAITGQDHSRLGVAIDGVPVDLSGLEPLDAGALLLFVQLDLRMAMKPDHPYWNEIRRDLAYRRDEHIGSFRESLRRSRELMGGMAYRPRDLWEHMRAVADDPHTVISINPPTYKGGFEKFYDTGGRLTWNEPGYEIFDAAVHQYELADEARDWQALLLCQQQQEPGHGCDDIVHARDLSRGQCVYVWTNRGPEVLRLLGRSAVPRSGSANRPEQPILPYNHEVTPDSRIQIARIGSSESRYLKDLWLHKLDYKQAGVEFAVYIDGHVAGIAGYDARPIFAPYSHGKGRTNCVILTYATACPHKDRLTRLVTMLALNWPTLRQCIDPWTLTQLHEVVTVELTRLPEIKGLRGLMKLDERIPDKTYGNRLVYVAKPTGRTPHETLAEWHQKEEKWRKLRAQPKA